MVLTSFDGKKEAVPLMLTRCVEIPPLFGIRLEIKLIIKIVPLLPFRNQHSDQLYAISFFVSDSSFGMEPDLLLLLS